MSPKSWQERIEDIQAAIAEIETFVAGLDRRGFLADAKTVKAVVANLTIIGEAARHVPPEISNKSPGVPWGLIRGMRNRIVHAYYEVDPEIVWNTCQQDLPMLAAALRNVPLDDAPDPEST